MRYLNVPAHIVVFVALVYATPFAQRPFDVKFANERLSVRAADAPLADVIAEVARLAGIEVGGGDKLRGPLSIDFSEMAPKDALAKILSGVNYVIQERPAPGGTSARQIVVSVHSMAGYALPTEVFSGPLDVPALDALVAKEAADVEQEKEVDTDDDPDASFAEVSQDKLAAAKLASEGAFGPKADVTSIAKHAQNFYNDEIRLEAMKTLGTRPMPSVLPHLIKALGDEAWEVRTAGVDILGRATDRESLQAVGQLLEKAPDPETRVDALRVLARRGDPESAIHLRAVLKDDDKLIRESAERMLAELDRRERAKAANGPK
jgi:hypothetical protein